MSKAVEALRQASVDCHDDHLAENVDRLVTAFQEGAEIEDRLGDLAMLVEELGRQPSQGSNPVQPRQGQEHHVAAGAVGHVANPSQSPAVGVGGNGSPLESSLLNGDPQMHAIVVAFVEQFTDKRAAMRLALQQQDMEELASLAHWLKGSGGTMGFAQLSEVGRKFEEAILGQQTSELENHLNLIDDMAHQIVVPDMSLVGQ